MCFVRNGDERLSSVFSIDGNDWRMRLQLSSLPYFTFGLDPVDKSKTVQLRGEWKLSIRNGQGLASVFCFWFSFSTLIKSTKI
jgi:hypothetical protein